MKRVILGMTAALSLLIVACPSATTDEPQVKNIIVMIGDGMGLSEISYTDLVSDEPLFIERVSTMGLTRTASASHLVTDSAAAATAFACGEKTNNGVLGLSVDGVSIPSIMERAKGDGFATGLVATYAITHATPAGYVAHNPSRYNSEGIALDVLSSDLDLFIAGGRRFFEERKDGRNLSEELISDGYNVVYTMEGVEEHSMGRLAAMLADDGLPSMAQGRGDMLPRSTAKALSLLSQVGSGFVLMVEGSQIDGMGHDNDAEGIVRETLDFDAAVKVAFDFADSNPGTLVLVFGDHETGGLTLPKDAEKTGIAPAFSTGDHTGVMIPIYAYGDGESLFSGVMDNTDIPKRMAKLLDIEW